MKYNFNKIITAAALALLPCAGALASSHREAPLISRDPQADNTDVYAFRSPADTSKIIIIADYIPFQLPQGGPNWYTFGENIRYEIHIKNTASFPNSTATTNGDDITYRFTFAHVNEDTTTFFNIRAGKQNIKTTYICEKSTNGGLSFTTISQSGGGIVPPPNIGPRSIEGPVGLGAANYDALMLAAVGTATSGERMYAGPADDPFFVDLGGAFDVGNFRQPGRDGLAKYNVHSIVLEIPIASLQASGKNTTQATSILDPSFVIGVWASASRQAITTLSTTGGAPTTSGSWVQISRLGMPLTNEAIIPIGSKDRWNGTNPYTGDLTYASFFKNPELALYMDSTQFGLAVPGLYPQLRIQSKSLGTYDFRNYKSGLYALHGTSAVAGTALAPGSAGGYGDILLPDASSPRAVDILPIFYTGVPNLSPYQLATGKPASNPVLGAGKPFINNFLPTLCDMLRLNMAVPVTPRNDPNFSSLGILKAAAIGLTVAPYNASANLQFIPNMDGFPNGRRLEDDVTTIELQAVAGVALAAIGLWYDDYTIATGPVTPQLLNVLTFNAGVTHNDTTFKTNMPFVQQPWRGFNGPSFSGPKYEAVPGLNLGAPVAAMVAYPNPFRQQVSFKYRLTVSGSVRIDVMDLTGRTVQTIMEGMKQPGEYTTPWNSSSIPAGNYVARMTVNGGEAQVVKLVKTN